MSYDYAVKGVHRMTDGDTVHLVIDVGFRATLTQRIRLAGIDAPEHGAPGSEQAETFLFDWLMAREGKLRVSTSKEDSFGRWIGVIYDRDSGDDASAALLMEGLAKPWVRR